MYKCYANVLDLLGSGIRPDVTGPLANVTAKYFLILSAVNYGTTYNLQKLLFYSMHVTGDSEMGAQLGCDQQGETE